MTTNRRIVPDSAHLTPRPLRLRVDTQTEDVRVEVIPLIDVIFCILTFFLLSAVGLSRQQAIDINLQLPKASTGTPQGREILVVSLNELGQVYVEQQPVTTEKEFRQKLRDYRQKNPEGLMALYAATNTSYNKVVQVLDLLRQEGGNRVALATLPGGSQEQSSGFNPPVPPSTAVPGYTPYPGEGLPGSSPYGTQNPANPAIPTQPQAPGNPGQPLPGLPSDNLNNPPPLPGQPGANPGTATTPAPGTQVTPGTNTVPGASTAPAPGTQVTPGTNTVPGTPTAPAPGTQVAPGSNSVPRTSTTPAPGTQVSPRANPTP
jgi:biopolymer transport protein ExbD